MKRLLAVLTAVLGASGLARADVVHLKGGGRIEGEIVEDRADAVVVEVSAGRITIPRSRVEGTAQGTSALAQFRARSARLAGGDIAGWLALGEWARDHDLLTQARAAFEHVLAIDPTNARAHQALGDVLVAGRWLTLEDSRRARGLVEFDGEWVTPAERQALVAERAAETAARREALEAEARIREAEARARAAEAEARRIEADQQQAAGDGFPYPYVFGGGFGPVLPPVDAGTVGPPPPPPVVVVAIDPQHGHRHRDRAPRDRDRRPDAKSSRAGLPEGRNRDR